MIWDDFGCLEISKLYKDPAWKIPYNLLTPNFPANSKIFQTEVKCDSKAGIIRYNLVSDCRLSFWSRILIWSLLQVG